MFGIKKTISLGLLRRFLAHSFSVTLALLLKSEFSFKLESVIQVMAKFIT